MSAPGIVTVASSTWDTTWCDVLLDVVGQRGAIRIHRIQEAYGAALKPLAGLLPDVEDPRHLRDRAWVSALGLEIVGDAEDRERALHAVRHRALADAESMRRAWIDVGERVSEWTSGKRS